MGERDRLARPGEQLWATPLSSRARQACPSSSASLILLSPASKRASHAARIGSVGRIGQEVRQVRGGANEIRSPRRQQPLEIGRVTNLPAHCSSAARPLIFHAGNQLRRPPCSLLAANTMSPRWRRQSCSLAPFRQPPGALEVFKFATGRPLAPIHTDSARLGPARPGELRFDSDERARRSNSSSDSQVFEFGTRTLAQVAVELALALQPA